MTTAGPLASPASSTARGDGRVLALTRAGIWVLMLLAAANGLMLYLRLVGQIGAATFQVAAAGDNAQVARAKELLAQTRRGLYQILADDEPGDQPKD